MPPETDEYRRLNPNSPFRTAAIGTKVTHKQDNAKGEIVGQEQERFRIKWHDPNGEYSTWHDAAVLDIHWGTEPKVQRGDVVTRSNDGDYAPTSRYVVTQTEENGDIEVLNESGTTLSIGPNVTILSNMRERGLALLALQERRKKLTEALEAEDEKIEQANQMIREAQDRRDVAMRSKGMLANLVDEMLYDS